MPFFNSNVIQFGAFIILMIGIFLFVRGWKGRKLLTPARCRKCKYEVHATLQHQPPGEARCPECGSNLSPRRAIIFGKRKRRRGLMVTGFLIVLLPALYLSVIAAQLFFSLQINWNQYRPTSNVISHMITSPDEHWVWQEITTRPLTPAQREKVVDNLIQLASTASGRGTSEPFSIAFEHFDGQGLIDEDHFKRYYAALLSAQAILESRQQVREGEPFYFAMMSSRPFIFPSRQLFVFALREAKVGGRTLPLSDALSGIKDPHLLSAIGNDGINCAADTTRLPLGVHTVEMIFDAGIGQPTTARQAFIPPGQKDRWQNMRAICTFTLTRQIEVVPSDHNVITLHNDPANDLLATGFTLPTVFIRRTAGGVELGCEFIEDDLSLPMRLPYSYDVIVRLDGQEHLIQKYLRYPGGIDTRKFSTLKESPDPAGRKVDLILRPSPSFAERYPQISVIWGQEIIRNDYPLERYDLDE